eukprot:scaffold117936_cov63-Phaeocystis_antarctica.AAC.12
MFTTAAVAACGLVMVRCVWAGPWYAGEGGASCTGSVTGWGAIRDAVRDSLVAPEARSIQIQMQSKSIRSSLS